MTTPDSGRLEFANTLRGLAAIVVLFGHYVLVFHNLKGSVPWFPSDDLVFFDSYEPWAMAILRYLNPGSFAVSLFFLISGLVIPQSVAALASKKNGRTAFAVGRLFRIWPTYCICLTISLTVMAIMPYLNNWELPFTRTGVLANMSLFRGLFGMLQFDGVVWTLEIEVFFYLYVLLVWRWIAAGKMAPLMLITIVAIIASSHRANIEMSYSWNGLANFLYPLPYLLFMSIGIAFNYHSRNLIRTCKLALVAVCMLAAFWLATVIHDWDRSTPSSYTIALGVFALFYSFARGWGGGPILGFLAKISFPLYAVHPVLGYTGMAFLRSLGVSDWGALFTMVVIAVLVAWAIHLAVEVPTHKLGKELGMKVTAAQPLMPTVENSKGHLSPRTSS